MKTRTHTEDTTGFNVIGEIPGIDPQRKNEVVLLGAHLDSWHAATGAVDDGAGCAVMMEAMRILKAVGARPARTIRVVLWTGEEQDYNGSLGYVRAHYGDPETMSLKPEHDLLSAYESGTEWRGFPRLSANEFIVNVAPAPCFVGLCRLHHWMPGGFKNGRSHVDSLKNHSSRRASTPCTFANASSDRRFPNTPHIHPFQGTLPLLAVENVHIPSSHRLPASVSRGSLNPRSR